MKKLILAAIRFYQKTAFFHGTLLKNLFLSDDACRFTPSCSHYTYEAVEKYGSVKGLKLGLLRIIRCHPWSKGGYDPVL